MLQKQHIIPQMIALRSGHCIAMALAASWPALLSSCGTPGLGKPKRLEVVQKSERHTQSRFEAMGTLSFVKSKGTKYEPACVQAAAYVDGQPGTGFMVWPVSAVPHQSLDLSKRYLLEFHEDTFKWAAGKPRVLQTFFRVRDPETKRILADASVCPLHREPMDLGEESGVYGGDYPDSYFLATGARAQKFPHDGKAYLLCSSWLPQVVWTCPRCHQLSDKWANRHDITD